MSRATHVTVADPDNLGGAPAYDGPDTEAHKVLMPGAYAAETDTGTEVRLVVTTIGSRVR